MPERLLQIREKLALVDRWQASGVLIAAAGYEERCRRKLAGQPIVRKGAGSGIARVKKALEVRVGAS